jgi:hypothetical protein
MANRGWDSQQGGDSGWGSTARQSGRMTGTGDAEAFIKPNQDGNPGGTPSDPMGTPGDLYEIPGNLEVPHN